LKKLEGKAVQEVKDIASYLREGLNEKRYFIVLDDLWNISDWEWIRDIAFPCSNNKGSRVIVTTRENGVAEACTTKPFIYSLKQLEEECAMDLFLRKIGKSKEEIENDNMLKTMVKKIVKKCGCLPLAILTIGAMFANTHVEQWEKLLKQLPSELESNPNLEAIRRIVSLSYSHLPSHLKPCLLYLSIFPEDFQIKRRSLINRWIAEGFVRARVGMTLEDVGESYFNELIKRSMIQPSRVNLEGRVKSCRVHDIMRDIIVSISREENFVYSMGDNNVLGVVEQNFRHVAYHGSNYTTPGMDWSRVRSLTFFGERPTEPAPSLCSPQLRMLRALDLENAQAVIRQKEISNIGLLRHLKYLNAPRFSTVYKLPRAIGKLQGLQTLDIRDSDISTLPTEITKLQSLRSLRCSKRVRYEYFDLDNKPRCLRITLAIPLVFNEVLSELHRACSSCWSKSNGVRVPKGIRKLKELQILQVVDIRRTNIKAIEELGELGQLQKLKVTTGGATDEKCKTFCKAIQKLPFLRSLFVDGVDNDSFTKTPWLGSALSPPPLLRSLTLGGYIGKTPDWFRDLTQLVKISFFRSELQEGKVIEILGKLPNLMLLDLRWSSDVGKELVFPRGAFPCLRKLYLRDLGKLRGMRFEEGASLQIERIGVWYCRLDSGIVGIKHLPALKEISLGYGAEVASLGALEEEVNAHRNHPVLRLWNDRRNHDLGEVEGSDLQVQITESAPES
jgi:disease resistance protein RPM1